MNIRVSIRQFGYTVDAGGGQTRDQIAKWDVWANKKDPSGFQIANQAQQTWQYDTIFKVRYNSSFKSSFTLVDETGEWTIKSVQVDSAGYKEFMFLSCAKIDDKIS